MKNILNIFAIIIVLFTVNFSGNAQSKWGNEWIKPSKTYLKLKVAENGIYKVTYEELMTGGLIMAPTNGTSFQMFNYGKELAIHVSDNDFGPGDHIEFYGKKNTIGLDSLLYDNWRQDMLNPEYSLVNDTNAYFLTPAPENTNLRYTQKNPNYNTTTLAPFPYYMHEEKVVYSAVHFKNAQNNVRNSFFESSEGFCAGVLQTSNTNFKTSQYIATGPSPSLSFRLGLNGNYAKLEIGWNGTIKETRTSPSKLTLQFDYTLEGKDIKADNILNIKNIQSTEDRHLLAYATLTYPRGFDFNNQSNYNFTMTPMSGTRLLEISAFNNAADNAYLYDYKNNIRYSTKLSNGKTRIIIDGSPISTNYQLVSATNGFKTVPAINQFMPTKFDNVGQQYIIISNKTLYATGPDYVQEYADYRSSDLGGKYNTSIVEIQDIYDHFGYGIDRHFVSIKQFSAFMKANWTDARFVFIIGKGLEYPYLRTANDVINFRDNVYFVPTFGFSGSDNMLFSVGNFPDPSFAVGRLAARTAEDIKNYLDKIKIYDQAPFLNTSIEDKYWRKKVLHLGGGKTEGEQNDIKNGLDNMASILTDTIYGAEVKSFFKNSFDAVQFNVNEEINEIFNTGVNLVNFFGHSSAGTWDFSIENPRNFNNYGKFPFINSFGCYSGNLHGPAKGISESFVLEKDRGAIAFFASTGTAFIPSLTSYGYRMYKTQLGENRNKSIGETIQKLAKDNRNSVSAELNLYAQLTLHGDPAINLHLDKSPDYTFDATTVKTNPATIQAANPKYDLLVDIVNLGAYSKDSFDVTFYHFQPDGLTIDTINKKLEGIANKYTLNIGLKNYGSKSVGKHKVTASIDGSNVILELPLPGAEDNNDLVIDGQMGFEYFVSDNGATTIYPSDFAMINTKEHFILKASTSSVPVAKADYLFQIDTTAYFNSPLREVGKVASEGGFISYVPKMPLVADRVYYWRVSPDSISPVEGYKWSQASFAYLPNEEEGWNQSHFFQFAQNEFNDLELSEATDRKFEFGKDYNFVQIINKVWDPFESPGYIFGGNKYKTILPWEFMNSGIAIIINGIKTNFIFPIKVPPGGLYGSLNPTGSQVDGLFFETGTPEKRKLIIDFLENIYDKETFLSIFTIQKNANSKYLPNEWANDSLIYGKNLFSVLEKLGARKVRDLEKKGSVPYIFQVGPKSTNILKEEVASNSLETIEISSYLQRVKINGISKTKDIKIDSLKSLKLNISEVEHLKEKLFVDLKIIDKQGVTFKIDSLISQNKIISRKLFPDNSFYLENVSYDSINRTSPQLNYWRFTYDALPDAAISYVKSEPNLSNTEISQGEKIKIHYDVVNVNYVPMDSILVKYTLSTSSNQSTVTYKTLKPLGVGEKINDIAEFTVGAGSLSELRIVIEINPGLVQPELHTFNNTLSKQWGVSKDKDNPLLDIYFDGIHIMDGDIVSPKPEILVTLADDNTFLPITDPELFEIKLDTGRNQFLEIPMKSPQIKFTPADQTNKTAKVMYYPTLSEGEYTLIVQGKDASGNKSGIQPRSVNFKVIEKQSVTNVLNYPNPFSTSTQFVFTLTGEQIPDIMSISIMTITGKVVKEITKDELGSLHIGVNRTEYKWDGTDDYGSKLANGVYLYKVNIRKENGEKYDHLSNKKSDTFFTEGFGKMVILR